MNAANTISLFVDAHVFDGEFQGSRTFISNLYNALKEKPGLKLYLAAYDIGNLKNHFPQPGNVTFIQYRSRSLYYRLLIDIPRIIKRHGIQYAHFQYITPLFKNCRFVVTTHDVLFCDHTKEFSFWYRNAKKFLYKFSAKKADILTTVSAYSKQSITRYLHIPESKIAVLHHGVNTDYFKTYDKKKEKEYIHNKHVVKNFILYVSRMEPRKNHALLLKAYLDLQLYNKEISLVFIGHQTLQTPAFTKQMAELPPAAGKFIFLFDRISDEELYSFYKAAIVFVYPSKAEGFGMPPLEAAALKIPVLCSNATAMADYRFFGEGHVDVSDYTGFKNRLSAMVTNPPDENLLNNIAGHIQKNYCWAKTADSFYRLLKQNSQL